jgi:hypothetical protein
MFDRYPALAMHQHNSDRSPQTGGGTAFGMGVLPAWE